jgi:tRNA G18 (ribose-2'-O)-methylase SpoU
MPVIRIDRFDDPRLAAYRSVSDAELLCSHGWFVAEGRLVVRRLLESEHRVESLLVNDASLRALQPELTALAHDVPVYLCDTSDFPAITGFNLHRGCLAVAQRPAETPLVDVVQHASLVLVLEAVSDADNIGSAFRNAAAFGACVVLSGTCCDPLYRKAIRTSMGSVLRTPYAHAPSWPADLDVLKRLGFTIVALTPREGALDLRAYTAQPHTRIALLVGSEGAGLSAEVEAMADIRIRIAIRADVDSLNLATATGIALYKLANPQP